VDLTDGLGEFLFQRDVLYTRMNCDRSTTNPLRAESHCAYRGTLQYSHANRVVRRLVGSASVCSQLCDLNMAWCLATYTEGADCFLLSTAQLVEDNPERLEDEIRTKESEAFSRCDPQVICSLASPFNLVGSVGTVTINGYVAVNSCASRMVASLGSCASEPRSRTWGLTRTQCRSSCCATEDCTAAEYGESAHGTRYCDLIGVGGSAAVLSNMDAVVCYDSAGDPRRDPITGYYALDGDALLGTGHAPAKHLRDLPVSSLEVCAELADEAYPSPSLGFLLDGEDCYLFPAEDYPAAEGFTEVSAGDGAPRSNFLVRDPAASNAPDKFVYSRLPGDLPVVENDFLTLQGACTDEVGLYVLRVELLRDARLPGLRAVRRLRGVRELGHLPRGVRGDRRVRHRALLRGLPPREALPRERVQRPGERRVGGRGRGRLGRLQAVQAVYRARGRGRAVDAYDRAHRRRVRAPAPLLFGGRHRVRRGQAVQSRININKFLSFAL